MSKGLPKLSDTSLHLEIQKVKFLGCSYNRGMSPSHKKWECLILRFKNIDTGKILNQRIYKPTGIGFNNTGEVPYEELRQAAKHLGDTLDVLAGDNSWENIKV